MGKGGLNGRRALHRGEGLLWETGFSCGARELV